MRTRAALFHPRKSKRLRQRQENQPKEGEANRNHPWNPDSLFRHDDGRCLRAFHEKQSGKPDATLPSGICRRGNGCRVGLEPAHSCYRAIGFDGSVSFVPAFAGFWFGVLFLLALDHLIPHLHVGSEQSEGPKSKLSRTTMMVLAVTLHNIPEGMAVGVMYAGFLSGNAQITAASALALSLGIAIQNFPEGAIISMPLRAEGMSRRKAFAGGVVSGIVEPIGAVLTIIASQLIIAALPYLLSFAAGAMLYVVVEELMPELSQGKHSNLGTVFFAIGFSLMMVLDVALG